MTETNTEATYKEKLIEDAKLYAHIDYDDDQEIVSLMVEVALQELGELIDGFDENALTPRQRLLVYVTTKELYDNREKYKDAKAMSTATASMLLKEIYKGGSSDG